MKYQNFSELQSEPKGFGFLHEAYQIAILTGNTRKAKKYLTKLLRLSCTSLKASTIYKARKRCAKRCKAFKG